MEEQETSDSPLPEVEECGNESDSVSENRYSDITDSEVGMEGQSDETEEVTENCNIDIYREYDDDELKSRQSDSNNESKVDIDEASYHDNEEHFIPDVEVINDDSALVSDQQSMSESVSSADSVRNFVPASTKLFSLENRINCQEIPVRNEIEQFSQDAQEDLHSGLLENIKIETITVTEDEDLFDFEHTESKTIDGINDFEELANKTAEGSLSDISCSLTDDKFTCSPVVEEEQLEEREVNIDIHNSELYKYLTAPNIDDIKSAEVTPQQSDHDSDEESDSGSQSGDSDSGSYTTATSVEDNKEETTQNQAHATEKPDIELTDNNVVEKPKTTPVIKKPFRPRLTKKMRNLLAKTTERMKKSKDVTDKWLKELELPKNLDLSNLVKLNIGELNQYLTCGLCTGYLYEASTVTECMHTFCKTCIVRHCMEVSLNCPVCNILIHPTDPFVNIRLDRMIQDIVYKLLPNVAEAEMRNINEFYASHPDVEPKEMTYYPGRPKISPAKTEECTDSVPLVSLVLESESESPKEKELEKKFVRVKGSATIANLSHFLKKKLCLEGSKDVDIFCCGDVIEESSSTLQNIREKFFNNDEDCLMLLQFRVCSS